jgi:hypothetical protein
MRLALLESALRMAGCTLQLFMCKRAAIDRIIESPCCQFPDLKLVWIHGSTSHTDGGLAVITVAP